MRVQTAHVLRIIATRAFKNLITVGPYYIASQGQDANRYNHSIYIVNPVNSKAMLQKKEVRCDTMQVPESSKGVSRSIHVLSHTLSEG